MAYKPRPYLENTKAPVELLGISPLLNPLMDHTSSQRGVMFSNHLAQAQIVHGCEYPIVSSGFEGLFGDYEFDPTERDQDIQIRRVIPKFITQTGMNPIRFNPYHTVIYRGDRDNKISYFNRYRYTFRSSRYGYKNQHPNSMQLNPGNYIPKDMKLSTSPAHKGNKYCMGVNLNIAYMSIPQVTEDAFVISESAAKKLSSDGIDQVAFKIMPNQIPLNLYGNDVEYKIFPDVGECVNDEGVLCALRTPTQDTLISDISQESLSEPQYLHDDVYFVPKGAEIIDVDVYVNRKCRVKTPREVFTQIQKYRDATNQYNIRIWESYQEAVKEGKEITQEFNTLVKDAMENLLSDNVHIPGFSKRADVTLTKKKETIEFIYCIVTFKYTHETTLGYKLTSSNGDKGVVGSIWPDDWMPVDDHGIRADVIADGISGVNRMNPGQWYVQYFTRGAEMIRRRMEQLPWRDAYNLMMDYVGDINYKWREHIEECHPNDILKEDLVKESIKDGILIQISPFQKGIDTQFILDLEEKYQIGKTPVTFKMPNPDGTLRTIRTKAPVMIGSKYFYLLYKMPHMSTAGIAYVNQYHSPVRPSAMAKLTFPYSKTPLRLGEDENRNLGMVAGFKESARILGLYANSQPAVNQLIWHQLSDPYPMALDRIEMSTEDIIKSNSIIGVTRHMFATFGVDIAPPVVSEENDPYNNLQLPGDRK